MGDSTTSSTTTSAPTTTTPSPASPNDLTTLSKVKSWLKQGSDYTDDDALLSVLITAVSQWMVTFMSRNIINVQYTEMYNGNGKGIISLRNRPVVSVSSVVMDGQAITGFDYDDMLLYRPKDVFAVGIRNVQVQYTAGFGTTAPADLDRACVEIVGIAYKDRDHIDVSGKTLAGENVTFIKEMPEHVKTILNQYRNVTPNMM